MTDTNLVSTSSANRLHSLVQRVALSKTPNEAAWKSWSSVVGEDNLDVQGIRRLGKIWNLLAQVRSDITEIYGPASIPHLDPVQTVESLLAPERLVQPWKASKVIIDQRRVLWGLQFLYHEFEIKIIENRLPMEAINSVLENINDSLECISQAKDLDPDLAIFLIDQLNAVRVAIYDYRVLGIEAILLRIHQSVGAIVTSGVVADAGGSKNDTVANTVKTISDAANLVEQSKRFVSGAFRVGSSVGVLLSETIF